MVGGKVALQPGFERLILSPYRDSDWEIGQTPKEK